MKRGIAILGSTGSIGTQAIDVCLRHPDVFSVELLTARQNSALLIEQAVRLLPNAVVITDESKYKEVNEALSPHDIKVFTGRESINALVQGDNIDIVLAAMVGFNGLESTLAAIRAGKAIALANKETLVAAGSLVMALGTSIGGYRIIKAVGMDMVKLNTYQGFAADLAGAGCILLSSLTGIPVSTTHTKTTAIMGVGSAKRLSSVDWGIVKEMLKTWVLTFPGCGLIGYLMAKLFMWIF